MVDGQRSVLRGPGGRYDGAAPVYYLASVPVGARDVAVEPAVSGVAQTFSLIAGARVGPQPVVLYRDQFGWQPIDQINGQQALATPAPSIGLPGAKLPIRVRDVYLSWSGPDSGQCAPVA